MDHSARELLLQLELIEQLGISLVGGHGACCESVIEGKINPLSCFFTKMSPKLPSRSTGGLDLDQSRRKREERGYMLLLTRGGPHHHQQQPGEEWRRTTTASTTRGGGEEHTTSSSNQGQLRDGPLVMHFPVAQKPI